MDWYSWLSQSNLDADLVYEYSLLFSTNELEREDISHFNHEFLKSMGISIAKHRLEMLKLANKLAKGCRPLSSPPPPPVARLLAAVHKTKKCLAKCIASMFHQEEKSAIIVVPPRPSYFAGGAGGGGRRSKGAMLKRNKKQGQTDQAGKLMLKKVHGSNSAPSYNSSPVVYKDTRDKGGGAHGGGGGVAEEFRRWDSMFQDLKPT